MLCSPRWTTIESYLTRYGHFGRAATGACIRQALADFVAAPAKGVIRLQKGHLKSPAPILLALILILFLTCGASARRGERAVGPLLTVSGLSQLTGRTEDRAVIGRYLPFSTMMQTKQGSGPNADDNLTPSATGSIELGPSASPGSSQNRIVFCSNGVDLITNSNPQGPAVPDGKIDPTPPDNAHFNIWMMRSDGSEQRMLLDRPGDQLDAAYDPGGRLIMFSEQVGNTWQIFTLEVRDPSIIRQITTGPGNKRHPTFAPDSNYIAYQTDLNGNWDIHKILSTGAGNPVPVTSGPSDDTDPAWAPNGLLIAFTRDTGAFSRIFTTSPDGSDVQQLSDGGGSLQVSDRQPAWRENSTEVAFSSNRVVGAGDSSTDYNIWRMPSLGEANGATPLLVSNASVADTRDDTDPTWTIEINRAPTRIVFVSERNGNQEDIWGMQLRDWIPPVLARYNASTGSLTSELPQAEPRLATPGDDVTISVPVYDKDSGVLQVFAYIKDPDLKLFEESIGQAFDASFSAGHRFFEYDSRVVSTPPVELLDEDGDGVYSGEWSTPPVASGRDYIIDILVIDLAGNSLRYDDVYGFSTRMFSPRNNILFVSDYCEGQLFLADLGSNNDIGAAMHVESYWTYNPGYEESCPGTIDYDSIRGSYEVGYDVWRIICRGPVTPSVYQYYLPTVEYQLDPSKLTAGEPNTDLQPDRVVQVADRCIMWGAPHTGNVWISDGSIMDASTQADVADFVRRGGRLLISGEDIAWALTMNGTRQNAFLTNTLRARFLRDTCFGGRNVNVPYMGRNYYMLRTDSDYGIAGAPGDPVSVDPWVGSGSHAGDGPNWRDSGDNPTLINTQRVPPYPSGQPWFADAAWYSIRPDAIEALDAVKLYAAESGDSPDTGDFSGGPTVGLRYENSAAGGGRLVYLSFGFEHLHRGYHEPTTPHCRNLRSHLLHNFACWSRTGGFQGRVVSVSDGGEALTNPEPIVSVKQGGTVRYAVRCQRDGTYVVQGLPPGYYDIEAARPGYEIDHYDGEYVHGGQIPRTVDFAIKRAQPGAISGTVVSAVDNKPLANVIVSVVGDPTTGTSSDNLPDPVRTSADGRYTLPYVPVGTYIVTADGQDILYGEQELTVTVNPGDTVTADFRLGADEGTFLARIIDVDTGDPIRNAGVMVQDGGGHHTTVYTDDSGTANIDLAPGTYTVSASAPGYQGSPTETVTIEPQVLAEEEIALKQQAGGIMLGRVVAAASGAFVGNVAVRVYFGDEEIATTQTSYTAVETINGVQYNYRIDDVPTGDVRVEAQRPGFMSNPISRDVLIESGTMTRDVNFVMESLRTFPRGLQLVSFPWDYSNLDPATLLGVSAGNLRMATWETTRQRYRLYPEAPADRFRLGTGYWMNLAAPADLSQEGLRAEDPVEIPLGAGWNLVGCPYNSRIDFYTSQVRDGSNIIYTLQQALSRGLIGTGLYAYVLGGYQTVGVLSPFTGYWVKANAPCSLIISERVGGLAAGEERDATPAVKDGWLLQLRTQVSGAVDTATYVGSAAAATAGCDFGLDQPKPPVPAMGAYVYTTIDNRDWASFGGDYAVDVRPADQRTTWNLKVYTNQVGRKVTLNWTNLAGLPKDVRPMLVDTKTGKQVYMRTSPGYSFVATDQARELQVVVTPQGLGQLVVTPQAASAGANGAAITYTLSRPAQVTATIANIAGRTVRQIATSEVQAAGQNTLFWDGRDARGLRAPVGTYLVTIIGRTDTGQEARTVVPLQKTGR